MVRMMLRSIGMIDRYELEKNYNRGLSEYKLPLIDLFILIYDGSVTLMEYWIIGGGD